MFREDKGSYMCNSRAFTSQRLTHNHRFTSVSLSFITLASHEQSRTNRAQVGTRLRNIQHTNHTETTDKGNIM